MKLTKDAYLYLAQFADDKTILSMLSVDKKFNDPKFFQQVLENKYPLLVKYKYETQKWKRFYIDMVYCISKIEEEHGISYYSVDGYNPKEHCNQNKQRIINSIMLKAAKGGQKDIINLMIEKGADVFDRAMAYAAKGGYKDIVNLMIEKGATGFNRAMRFAAYGGYKDIVNLMIKKGANHFDWAMANAATGGHKDIVEYLRSLQ